MNRQYASFREFYPDYLQEHSQPTTRRLHVIGLACALAVVVAAVWTGRWVWLLGALVVGYGAAWVGHFDFEKNRPATFKHPLYSFLGDLTLFKDVVTGRLKW